MEILIQYLQSISFVNSVAVVGLSFLFFLIFLKTFVQSGGKMGSTSLPTVPGNINSLFFGNLFLGGVWLCLSIKSLLIIMRLKSNELRFYYYDLWGFDHWCRGARATDYRKFAATEREETSQDIYKMGRDIWTNLFYQNRIFYCYCNQFSRDGERG